MIQLFPCFICFTPPCFRQKFIRKAADISTYGAWYAREEREHTAQRLMCLWTTLLRNDSQRRIENYRNSCNRVKMLAQLVARNQLLIDSGKFIFVDIENTAERLRQSDNQLCWIRFPFPLSGADVSRGSNHSNSFLMNIINFIYHRWLNQPLTHRLLLDWRHYFLFELLWNLHDIGKHLKNVRREK